MVNVFSRLARRATSSGSETVDSRANVLSASKQNQVRRRSNSVASAKQTRRNVDDRVPRRLIVVSDTADFDPRITHRFQAEGFDVTFIGFVCSGDSERDRKALENKVHEKEDEMEVGERYAIVGECLLEPFLCRTLISKIKKTLMNVAYGRPAYYLLACHHLAHSNTNPFPRLCALIAYYPLTSTDQWTRDSHTSDRTDGPACTSTASIFGPSLSTTYLPIQIHLPGHEARHSTVWPWIGTDPYEGDTTYKKRHRCYVYAYPDAQAGFAERTIDPEKDRSLHDQDQISSRLAWSRVIGCLRRAFEVGENWAVVDIETVWEDYWQRLLSDLDRGKAREREGGRWEDGESHEVGSVVDMMVSRERKHDGSFSGMVDLHEGEGPSVMCVPTKAGGEFYRGPS